MTTTPSGSGGKPAVVHSNSDQLIRWRVTSSDEVITGVHEALISTSARDGSADMAPNARDDTADALRGYDRSPEAVPSTHLWRGALPTDLAAGEHGVEVRTFDRWNGETSARATYKLRDAEP